MVLFIPLVVQIEGNQIKVGFAAPAQQPSAPQQGGTPIAVAPAVSLSVPMPGLFERLLTPSQN